MKRLSNPARWIAPLLAVPALLALTSLPVSGREKALTLRIQNAIGAPGGSTSVVLRTYSSKPIGQGQLCLRVMSTAALQPAGLPPAMSLAGGVVFSDLNDVEIELLQFPDDATAVVIQFVSGSATVNRSDGPLAAFDLFLGDQLYPGEVFDLVLDTDNTFLFDENGDPVRIKPRNGRLTIRATADPILLSAEAEKTAPGENAVLDVSTYEPVPVGSGQLGLRFDPAMAAGPPTVRMDPRHGLATFDYDVPTPGLVIVTFESAGGVLNRPPGGLIQVTFPTSPMLASGVRVPVELDVALSYLAGPDGRLIPLTFESRGLVFGEDGGRRRSPQPIQDKITAPAESSTIQTQDPLATTPALSPTRM